MAEPEIRMWKPGDPEPKAWLKERKAHQDKEGAEAAKRYAARIAVGEPWRRAWNELQSKSEVQRERGKAGLDAIHAEDRRLTQGKESHPGYDDKGQPRKDMKYAKGGKVPGKKTAKPDTVKARLTPGEFVVNTRATARHGDLLQKINRGGGATRYRST